MVKLRAYHIYFLTVAMNSIGKRNEDPPQDTPSPEIASLTGESLAHEIVFALVQNPTNEEVVDTLINDPVLTPALLQAAFEHMTSALAEKKLSADEKLAFKSAYTRALSKLQARMNGDVKNLPHNGTYVTWATNRASAVIMNLNIVDAAGHPVIERFSRDPDSSRRDSISASVAAFNLDLPDDIPDTERDVFRERHDSVRSKIARVAGDTYSD